MVDYEDLKKRGFLKQRQDGFVVLRTRAANGVYKKEHLERLADIAGKYGRGIVHPTIRQGLEIPFIKVEYVSAVEKELKDAGIESGVSGPRLRAITCCPGNSWCRFGIIDTFSLANKIASELGIKPGMELPHKFKIAISGCPNTCTRPQASEIGIHGAVDTLSADKHTGYAVYLGGAGGRDPHNGIKINKIFTEGEVISLVGRVVKFYKDNAKPRQRLSALIEETGEDRFLKEVVV